MIFGSRAILRPWLSLGLLAALVLPGCRPNPLQRVPITVASAVSPEQLVLGKMTVLALSAAGYRVNDKTGMGEPWLVRAALETGTVDLCWDYTGDAWLVYLQHDLRIADPGAVYATVRAEDARNQLSWLAMSPYTHTLALAMRADLAGKHQIAQLSDLAGYIKQVNPDTSLCVPEKLYESVQGIRGLERLYGMRFNRERAHFMSSQDGYRALADGTCDCVLGFSSDPEARGAQVRMLADDRGFFQASNLAPVLRTPILEELPSLEPTLAEISRLLTPEVINDFQRQVTENGRKPEVVARGFLMRHGMLKRGWGAPTPTMTTGEQQEE
jgi:osmoprotectant transport system substrate-binding protein